MFENTSSGPLITGRCEQAPVDADTGRVECRRLDDGPVVGGGAQPLHPALDFAVSAGETEAAVEQRGEDARNTVTGRGGQRREPPSVRFGRRQVVPLVLRDDERCVPDRSLCSFLETAAL